MIWAVGKPVGSGAQVDRCGHDQLFADGVDRGVGDLGKELAEVLVKEAGATREDSQGGIVTHRACGLLALLNHG